MKKIFALAAFVLMSVGAMAQQPAAPADTLKKAEPAKLAKGAYTINIPEGWRISDACKEELCSLFSPYDTVGTADIFVENINITVNKLNDPSYTAEKYLAFSVDYLPKVVKGFKVLSRKKLKANSSRLVYRGEKDGKAQTWIQDYHVKGSKVYIVTFAGETAKYDYYQPLVQPYVDSFRLR